MPLSRLRPAHKLLLTLLLAPLAAAAEGPAEPAAPPSAAASAEAGSAGLLAQAARLREARQPQQAQALVAAQREPANPEALSLAGVLASVVDRDADKAVALLERAVELSPGTGKYHLALGNLIGARAMQAGMLKALTSAGRIKEEYEQAVQLDPGSVDAHTALLNYLLLAPGIAGGSVNKARVQAIEIGRIDPAAGAAAQAAIEDHEDELDKAAALFDKAIALARDARARSQYWNQQGYLRLKQERADEKTGDKAGARTAYERFLVLRPASRRSDAARRKVAELSG